MHNNDENKALPIAPSNINQLKAYTFPYPSKPCISR